MSRNLTTDLTLTADAVTDIRPVLPEYEIREVDDCVFGLYHTVCCDELWNFHNASDGRDMADLLALVIEHQADCPGPQEDEDEDEDEDDDEEV